MSFADVKNMAWSNAWHSVGVSSVCREEVEAVFEAGWLRADGGACPHNKVVRMQMMRLKVVGPGQQQAHALHGQEGNSSCEGMVFPWAWRLKLGRPATKWLFTALGFGTVAHGNASPDVQAPKIPTRPLSHSGSQRALQAPAQLFGCPRMILRLLPRCCRVEALSSLFVLGMETPAHLHLRRRAASTRTHPPACIHLRTCSGNHNNRWADLPVTARRPLPSQG